jgi:hypothetical protein
VFTEKLATFFNTKEHAITAVYTPQGGGGSSNVDGLFEAEYRDPLGLVQSEEVTFTYELAKTPSVKDGDQFVVNGKTYLARLVKRDWGGGLGVVMVFLEEQ